MYRYFGLKSSHRVCSMWSRTHSGKLKKHELRTKTFAAASQSCCTCLAKLDAGSLSLPSDSTPAQVWIALIIT